MIQSSSRKTARLLAGFGALFAVGCGVISDAGSIRNLSPGIDLPTIDGGTGGSSAGTGGASASTGGWPEGGAGGADVEHFGGGGSIEGIGGSIDATGGVIEATGGVVEATGGTLEEASENGGGTQP